VSLIVERVQGAAIEPHLPALAELRIAVFREYPYLYAGTLDYERSYLASYAASPTSLVVLARDGARIVGAATAMPLLQHTEQVAPPLIAAGYDPARVFYFGESVLDRAFRGHGLGNAFFTEREAHARTHGFVTATFCAVARPDDHPHRPADYQPLDRMWQRHGFAKRPDITTTFSWRDLDDRDETAKSMVFWIKELA
jgi:GNAT superfamily N-acetyltransferase